MCALVPYLYAVLLSGDQARASGHLRVVELQPDAADVRLRHSAGVAGRQRRKRGQSSSSRAAGACGRYSRYIECIDMIYYVFPLWESFQIRGLGLQFVFCQYCHAT